MNIQILKANYSIKDDRPQLNLSLSCQPASSPTPISFTAVIHDDTKYSLLEDGIIPLWSREVEVSKILPPIDTSKDSNTGEQHFEGYTNDPLIVKMTRDFYDAINFRNDRVFKEGDVPVPIKV